MIDDIHALRIGASIVVLDHKSTDGTREVVLEKWAVLIDEPEQGKGAAVRKYFREPPPGDIVMIDADCTYPVSRIVDIAHELLLGSDVVIGCRTYLLPGAMSRLHRFGNAMLSLFASVLFQHRVHDVCSGMWGFGPGVAERLHLVSDGFTLEADLFANAVRSGGEIVQIPVEYAPRPDGSTAKLTSWDGMKIAWFLFRRKLEWV